MTLTSRRVGKHRKIGLLVASAIIAILLCASLIFLPGLRHPVRLFFPSLWKPPKPELNRCTRVEIEYRPSIFQFFFANPTRRGLLSTRRSDTCVL